MGAQTMGGVFGKDCKFKLTDAQKKLVLDHLKVVEDAVTIDWWKWYMRGFHSKDDAFQQGVVRLMQCAVAWDAERARAVGGKTFKIYVWQYVRRYLREQGLIAMPIRTPRRIGAAKVPVVFTANFAWVEHDVLAEIASEPADKDGTQDGKLQWREKIRTKTLTRHTAFDKAEHAEIAEDCLRVLKPREQRAIIGYFGLRGEKAQTCLEMANELGYSRSRMNQIVRGALNKMAAYADVKYKQLKELCYAA